jgi:ergothioneine biosynthesis protein EgtB
MTNRFTSIRGATVQLAAPLAIEDMVVQTLPEVSPTKWHLAHTTWFFETFVLVPFVPKYRRYHARYAALFNSYYRAAGPAHPQAARGHCSRPTVAEILAYRSAVDDAILTLLARPLDPDSDLAARVELGLQHEQQHQELILTDVKHVLAQSGLAPAYRRSPALPPGEVAALEWIAVPGGMVTIGAGDAGFAFDNERPRHRAWLEPYALAHRLVTCGEYAAFVADGGYARPELWLADGWDFRARAELHAPLYWLGDGRQFTLAGERALDPAAPVGHVSYYEADAYARWAGARLPSEAEWEAVAAAVPVAGNFVESGQLDPAPAQASGLTQLYGDVWQWTSSAYAPYPRYAPLRGELAEYNGKFMSGRMVLRGGSCLSPRAHLRASYRNFFPPDTRWQVAGIRLAR